MFYPPDSLDHIVFSKIKSVVHGPGWGFAWMDGVSHLERAARSYGMFSQLTCSLIVRPITTSFLVTVLISASKKEARSHPSYLHDEVGVQLAKCDGSMYM